MLKVQYLTGGYSNIPIVKNISFTLERGKVLGILGPNGCGKSTLLKLISGVLPKQAGDIWIDGKKVESYTTKALARKMAVLPQLHVNAFSNTVREVVSLGRYPHQRGFFSSWSQDDEVAVQRAMKQTGVTRYEHTTMEFLSGGEQQRVFVAQALAQNAEILLLDEPTNHLDITHQRQLLDMVRAEAIEQGTTVIAVFHDMNLASLYCDQLLLLESGEVHSNGVPHEVIVDRQIGGVYDTSITTYAHPEIPKPQITLMPHVQNDIERAIICKENFVIEQAFVKLASNTPLRAVSSAVHNAGIGWFDTFLNRSVPPDYMSMDMEAEQLQFLHQHQFSPTSTVMMLTAVDMKLATINEYPTPYGSLFVMVTAGVGNAVDVSRAFERQDTPYIGTINTWVIINGHLTDEAFIQAMMTATEAKTKALQHEDVKDSLTGTVATGTATDSLLIAATQKGEQMPYAGSVTEIGKVIGRGVFETTIQAIQKYKQSLDELNGSIK